MLLWTKELNVNVESIDVQHRTLIALINELERAIEERLPDVVVGSVLSKLIEYTRFHFDHEENCLIVGCYPKLNEHRCKHRELTKELKELEREYLCGVPGIASRVLEILQRWVMLHIMKTDRMYSGQLVKAGLQ